MLGVGFAIVKVTCFNRGLGAASKLGVMKRERDTALKGFLGCGKG